MVRPGDRVAARYEVIEQLASGAMGTLWRARHLRHPGEVALKVMSGASPILLERFKREADAASRLRSPNVVQVQDYGIHAGQPYLAMELLHGEDLAARIERRGALSGAECVAILAGVAQGIQAAHDAGIVHRDLKPANIFLEQRRDREQVKVLDFGVARDLACKTDPGTTNGSASVGSPAYMSPEQVWGEEVGPAADLWAMGVVAFEMLTGRCPFADETLAKVFERIIRAPLPKARDLVPALPPSIDSFFEHAFARAPAERFASAGELVTALEQALSGGFEPVRPAQSPLSAQERRKAASLATTQRRKSRPLSTRERRLRALRWTALALIPISAGWLLSHLLN
jgi:serine/threonine-protein kinase